MRKHLYSLAASFLLVSLIIAAGYANDGVSYTYDQLNRLIGVQSSDGTSVEYMYDDVGNRVTRNVTLSSGPEASFAADPASGTVPLTVSFTDQSTGTVNSRSWNFGDGENSTSQNPGHTYTSPGTYTAILTVSDGSVSSFVQETITVYPPRPTASFIAAPTSGTAPLTVSFTDSSSGAIAGWSWNFGDGGTSTGQNPNHTYTNPGIYTVTLTVSGPGGNSDPMTISITVVPSPPVAAFSATPANGIVPLIVQFTDTSTGTVTGWSWDFGEGGTSASQNPNHTYSAPGTYTVSLTATGPRGSNTNTQTNFIVVSAAPTSTPGIDQYTKLLLHGEGANGGTAITDSSFYAHAPSAVSGVVTSTAQKEFGTACFTIL